MITRLGKRTHDYIASDDSPENEGRFCIYFDDISNEEFIQSNC